MIYENLKERNQNRNSDRSRIGDKWKKILRKRKRNQVCGPKSRKKQEDIEKKSRNLKPDCNSNNL